MKVKLYRLQSLVNKDFFDRVNNTAKALGISQGELVRQAVLLYLSVIECMQTNKMQTEQQNETKPVSALLKLLEKK